MDDGATVCHVKKGGELTPEGATQDYRLLLTRGGQIGPDDGLLSMAAWP